MEVCGSNDVVIYTRLMDCRGGNKKQASEVFDSLRLL